MHLPAAAIITMIFCIDDHFIHDSVYLAYAAALLTVADDEFWEEVSPVEFGDLPTLQDAVTVVGYPIGGDTISVTSGVVSRIEILSYVHGSTELVGLQVDKFLTLTHQMYLTISCLSIY